MRRVIVLCVALTACPSDHDGAPVDATGSPDVADTGAAETRAGDDVADADAALPALVVTAVAPSVVDPLGGSRLVIRGSGFAAAPIDLVTLGDVAVAAVTVVSDSELRVVSAPMEPGEALAVRVTRGADTAELAGALDAWSPAELAGARLFDAAVGVAREEAATSYEWQRLTPEIAPTWRVRDGNTLTWLPATGRFWMVGGWNGYKEPDGFSPVDPDTVYPPLNTTDEVWSTADGVTWTPELAHGHGAFERRHSHNTVLWHDRLWMIGGDHHQGFYNHDVVASADGLTWDVVLAPGEPPWEPRSLQMSGTFDGRLWTMGGQEVTGDPATARNFNDVWATDDGVTWELIAPNAPASETRWAGCGAVDGIVEFEGRMWLVGCGRDTSFTNPETRAAVWSTADGVTWTQHALPPWSGKIWHNVVVWDDHLWILFGYTLGDPERGFLTGQYSEAWYSDDGDTWRRLPPDAPAPGSHAQGIAVHDDYLLYAGGNYSFGSVLGVDKSAWRLVPFRGTAAVAWTDRGADALVVRAATPEARPVHVADAFGPGVPGLQLDGYDDVLDLDAAEPEVHSGGRTVLWVARAPYLPPPYVGWDEVGATLATVLGGPGRGDGLPVAAVGLSDGQIVLHAMQTEVGPSGETVWTRVAAGAGLQEGPGEARLAGVTQAADGTLQAWIDGQPAGDPRRLEGTYPPAWGQIGGGLNDGYYGPNTRFAGTLGAVVILPEAASPELVARIHAWARGRFGVP